MVAAIYDIHGNLPALDAVLAEIRDAGIDKVMPIILRSAAYSTRQRSST